MQGLLSLAGVLLAALVATVSIPSTWTPRERAAAEAIAPPLIASHVRFLADDLLEGRAPGTRGGELATKYVASQFERLGLQPAGDGGSWFQRFDLVGLRSEIALPPRFTAIGARGKQPIAPKPVVEMVVVPGNQEGAAGVVDAPVVFAGYGIVAPEQQWDDYKDVDVRGKVLLVMNNDPESDPKLFAGRTRLYYGRWDYKYAQAARKGAAGVIIIHTTPSAGYPWQVVQTSWAGEHLELPARPGDPHLALRMWTTEELSRRLVSLGGGDLDELRRRAERRDFRPVPLGVALTVKLTTKVRSLQTANVLGLRPGRDATRGKELVVYSAHHDHLGIRDAKNGDDIYNGALDNASGVAALLAIAEGMSRGPAPARSVLFAAVAAEESGLLGSEFFCAHPIVPAGRIAANLNIDGINIWGPTRDVEFTGLGKSSLDEVVIAAAGEQGRVVVPDQFPDRGHFYRSDQFNFAKIGVPAVYLGAGMDFVGHDKDWGRQRIEEFEHTRYHQPSDQLPDGVARADHPVAAWNLDGAVDDVRLMAVVGLRIAEAKELPRWKPGDEFEAARKKALAP